MQGFARPITRPAFWLAALEAAGVAVILATGCVVVALASLI